ncbi:MAG: caspase family protein [Planctomycetia bacterium]|nr:caspase family protein [Planctomycetia bacterium]
MLPKGKKYAVLVGVTEYATMNNLRYTVRDVEAIREQLLKMGFEDENIHLLTTKNEKVANHPIRQNVERTIASVLSQAKLGDLVFFAFAGHGAQLTRLLTLLAGERLFRVCGAWGAARRHGVLLHAGYHR